ncbi:diacylglycerol kinase family protein [Planctellipticum variicoloris]|uniref:diacylglycerol kinase family protein n=1 Tax=Planctellipticum variicoloris TaxID=3064265 RepID=UPI003013F843|nr:diacylglycerol kinase family protein [Planctomycetaceae bacterium SH412]
MKQPPFLRSLRHAMTGLAEAVRSQRNAKIQLAIGVLAVIAAAVVGFDAVRWAILILTIGLVLASEIMNTAVEAAVDLTTAEVHPLARQAKDAAAGAVLCAAVTAILVGACLFGPPLWTSLIRTGIVP